MPRDRAVTIGLVINELVTNAAKHAFAGRDVGSIAVSFHNRAEGGWTVGVTDDGVGMPDTLPAATANSGLGSRLVEAFARQADGTITVDSDRTGTRVELVLGS